MHICVEDLGPNKDPEITIDDGSCSPQRRIMQKLLVAFHLKKKQVFDCDHLTHTLEVAIENLRRAKGYVEAGAKPKMILS